MMRDASMLIIEDDPTLLRGLVDKFRGEGFAVRVACDGFSAIDIAEEMNPDIVLLDVMLPGCNGFEVCQELRREGFAAPILMLSARGQERDVVRGLNLGADDYIPKPFSVAELQARVLAAIRRDRASGARTETYVFGDWTLEVSSRRLFRDGVEQQLSRQEFNILAYFLAQSGRALTREMILRAAGKRTPLTGLRSVDRCIKNLRAKIEADSRRPRHIHTVREIGYRFEKD